MTGLNRFQIGDEVGIGAGRRYRLLMLTTVSAGRRRLSGRARNEERVALTVTVSIDNGSRQTAALFDRLLESLSAANLRLQIHVTEIKLCGT